MEYDFGNYICTPNKDRGANFDYRFNESTLYNYIKEEEYDEAVKYLSQYTFKDKEVQQAHYNDILNLSREFEVAKAIYGHTPKDKLNAVKFSNSLFANGGLDLLSDDNEYKQKWVNSVKRIGSIVDVNNNIKEQATSLRFDFDSGKRTFLGLIDWLNKDSNVTISNFLESTNLDIDKLREAGVRIQQRADGSGSIEFSKSNPFANQLLLELNTFAKDNSQYLANDNLKISGINTKGKIISTDDYFGNIITGDPDKYNIMLLQTSNKSVIANDGINTNFTTNRGRIDYLQELINEADNIKNISIANSKPSIINYSSTVGGPISDELYMLDKLYDQHYIDDDEYYRRRKLLSDNIDNMFAAVSSSEKVYTNYGSNNKTLNLVSQEDRINALDEAKGVDAKRRHYNACIVNGIRGVLVTIDPKLNDDQTEIKSKGFEIFIPGLWNKLTQSKINSDANVRAHQEINNIQEYNYPFVMYNNDRIIPAGDGTFNYNDRINNTVTNISFEEALRQISKSYMLEDTFNNNLNYYNSENNIKDANEFYEDAKNTAIKFAQELYPNIELPITDENGIPTNKNIFDIINKGDDYMLKTLNKREYVKYKTIAEIFNAIMNHTKNLM